MSGAKRSGLVAAFLDGDRRSVFTSWAIRLRERPPARWRHGVRNRLDHQSVHGAVVCRHGAAGRSGAGRSCGEISSRRREDAGFRRRADHLAGSGDVHVGPAADAVAISRRKILDNPYIDYTAERLYDYLVEPPTRLQAGHALRIRQSRFRPAWPCARAACRQELRGTRRVAHLRAARHGRHPHHAFTNSMQQRLARGHNAGLAPVANWDFPALAGAGALRSTANDLLKFLHMCLDPRERAGRRGAEDGAGRAPSEGRRERRGARAGSSPRGSATRWSGRSGATGGYATFIGYSTKTRRNRILLSNAADYVPNIALGTHLVNAAYPSPKFAARCRSIRRVLAAYAGRYEISPTFILTVRPDGGRLFVQATGQAESEVYAESETEFFYRVVNAQISFARQKAAWCRC